MTNPDEYAECLKTHFTPLLAAHGETFRAADWGSKESQNLRFSVLSKLFEHELKMANNQKQQISVLDVGCGLGHYSDYLAQQNISVQYQGIDILPEMIDKARELRPEHTFSVFNLFHEKTIPGRFSYIVASGIFFRSDEEGMKEAIATLFQNSKRGLSFNSLSLWAKDKDVDEFYACPIKTLTYCHTLTPWVTLRHDYLPNDFTVYMYKEKLP
jgi:SAM-dependent methyltransferase